MDLQSFIIGFSEQFEDSDLESINANTDFKKLKSWDSLTSILVIGYISTECNKNLSKSEIDKCITVVDLYNYIFIQ